MAVLCNFTNFVILRFFNNSYYSNVGELKGYSFIVTELPPIKAPVGTTPPPNIKQVRSKIGSLDNVTHKPKGGDKKVNKYCSYKLMHVVLQQ